MASIRYRSTTFAALAAGQTEEFMFVTPDDNLPRKLTGILAPGGNNLGLQYRVQRAGYSVAEIDVTAFAPEYGFIEFDADFPVGIQFEIDQLNTSASSSDPQAVIIRYEV